MEDLFEEMANALRPENSPEPKTQLQKKAEKECARILDPSSSHFRNYVLMYMLGFQDAEIENKKESIILSSNLLG